MDQAAHSYLIFETAAGFCGIAWNSVGVTRFQLPTRSPEATKRILLRRAPGAKSGAPTPEVAEAIAAVKRYFEGEQMDFSGVRLDLGGQDPFFERIYEAARRVGWGHTTTYGALAKEPRRRAGSRARCRSSHGQESGGADHSLPQGAGGGRQGRRVFRAGGFGS